MSCSAEEQLQMTWLSKRTMEKEAAKEKNKANEAAKHKNNANEVTK